jgi:hypothetical protein
MTPEQFKQLLTRLDKIQTDTAEVAEFTKAVMYAAILALVLGILHALVS